MTKKTPVTCPYCKEKFYREEIDFVEVGRRYAHRECYNKKVKKEQCVAQIHEKMRVLLGPNYSKTKISRQIKELLMEGKTEQGIYNTLCYWYDIKKSDPSKANGGIGIVSFVYGQAMDYYFKLEENTRRNAGVNLASYAQPEKVQYKIAPTPIRKPVKVKLFELR